jgi:murein DD-endopeptidase MepM/ murein hydrolase activator NlpD
VLLAHLRQRSVQAAPGQLVQVGDLVERCGNSGNSTEPHVHEPVSDSVDWTRARGLPFAFGRAAGSAWVPANSEIVHG